MAKPTEVRLNKKEQKTVLSRVKAGILNVRETAKEFKKSRYDIMFFLEEQGLKKYSESSYS
jgi:hypothetical protein